MEVKSKEQKTFTYTLNINSGELDQLLEEFNYMDRDDVRFKKVHSLVSKLSSRRNLDLMS